jgi:hypothetical protein
MRIYVAGPMSGLPEHNFPAFHDAAARLRAAGYEVLNPAEQEFNGDLTKPWDFYLRRDIPLLCQCDAVALLDGFERSKGALLELHIASKLGMEIRLLEDWLDATTD